MMRLELVPDAAEIQFVWYWLQSSLVREFIVKMSKGTSPTMKKISQGIVMQIPYPTNLTVTEQGRIIAELDALQSKIDVLKLIQAETAAELDALLPSVLSKGVFRSIAVEGEAGCGLTKRVLPVGEGRRAIRARYSSGSC